MIYKLTEATPVSKLVKIIWDVYNKGLKGPISGPF